MNLSRVRPGREAGRDIELSKQAANHLVRIRAGAEAIELRHHAGQRPFHVVDGIRRKRFPLLFETPLPVRYYLPREDVRFDLLEPSGTTSICAYKGRARYWHARVGDRLVRDLVWSYEEPLHDAGPVRGLVAFFTERTDLVLDGEPVDRPVTPWS